MTGWGGGRWLPQQLGMAQVHFNRARLGKLADIGSGHKTGVTAGKYNRPHLPIASQCPKVLGELFTPRY